MTITFEHDNNVIWFALKKITSHAKDNQYMFMAQYIWWLVSIIGLQEGVIIHINNLRTRSEAYEVPSAQYSDCGNIHHDRADQVNSPNTDNFEVDNINFASSD